MRRAVALSIAGTDSGGGAGVAADLKTFEAHGVWGTAAITAVTAQDTTGVHMVEVLSGQLVAAQIDCVMADIGVDAVKSGMLGSADVVAAVVEALRRHERRPLVVDPVLASTHGAGLLDAGGLAAMIDLLLPLADVITPNLAEAARLTGVEVADRGGMEAAARRLLVMGVGVVMVTGGHLGGERSPDLVLARDSEPMWLDAARLDATTTHGTGCVLSAAIAAELARGMAAVDACVAAKHFVAGAIVAGVDLGAGPGPVDPGWATRR